MSVPLAIERVRAARAAIDASAAPDVVLTARCEPLLVGDHDPLQTVLDRLPAYAEAGADCLFAPGVRDLPSIDAIVRAASPRPVNVLVSSPSGELTLPRLAELGVRPSRSGRDWRASPGAPSCALPVRWPRGASRSSPEPPPLPN